MALQIKAGGLARWSFDVSTDTWSAGQILELDAAALTLGTTITNVSSGTAVQGIVQENKQTTSTVQGGAGFSSGGQGQFATGDQTKSSGKASLVLDEAVVVSDQLVSGITFSPGELIYCNSAGKLTDVSTDNTRVFGIALSNTISNSGDS